MCWDLASSKADIFAAKIAEAVDEANSSDSAETFVYESNPPDTHVSHAQRPGSRFHSRTPSATSLGPDPRGQRLPLINPDGGNTLNRKGMKFVNNSINKESGFGGDGMPGDAIGGERGIAGSSRDQNGRGDRSTRQHNGGHRSNLPDDSPRSGIHGKPNRVFMSASRTSLNTQPPSPKYPPLRNGSSLSGGKRSPRSRTYEADVENGDDEHTPLMMAGRSTKPRRNRNSRQLEHTARRRGCIRTYAGCIVAVFAIFAILSGVTGFLVSTTNALQGVKVLNVTDVLVSKQEIMLDLVVQAINPNAIAVTVGSMDVNLFAKSSHVREGPEGDGGGGSGGSDSEDWRAHAEEHHLGTVRFELPRRMYPPHFPHKRDNVDEGTDPPEDLPEPDKETMLLGRIFQFDSVLTFEGSPLRRMPSISVGELRLAKPGNKTEEGGSARWERVLLHPFELIVRGVLKYQLPLSGRIRTAPISGSVLINPELGNVLE